MLETSTGLRVGQNEGMEHCRNKYNGHLAVINSKEEATFLTSYLEGVTVSILIYFHRNLKDKYHNSY